MGLGAFFFVAFLGIFGDYAGSAVAFGGTGQVSTELSLGDVS